MEEEFHTIELGEESDPFANLTEQEIKDVSYNQDGLLNVDIATLNYETDKKMTKNIKKNGKSTMFDTYTQLSQLNEPDSIKEFDLEDRERQVERKERELALKLKSAAAIQDGTINLDEKNNVTPNWPFNDSSWSFIYHDIELEIPEEYQSILKSSYNTWKLLFLGLFLNYITILIASFHDNYYASPVEKGSNVFATLLYLVIGSVVSFKYWYIQLYNLAKSKEYKYSKYIIFTITSSIGLFASILMISGTPWYPCAGVFFIITALFTAKYVTFIFGVINACVWAVVLFNGLRIFRYAKVIYNNYSEDEKVNEENNGLDISKIKIIVDKLSSIAKV